MMPPFLQEATFKLIVDFIYETTGIFIPPTKKYLVENRLGKVIEDRNLRGYEELLSMVRYGSNGNERQRVIDAITTNETYFFREPQHFDVLTDHVVPRVLDGRASGGRDVKIWCAACSSGEEPFTISMLMREKRFNVRTEIHASDVSSRVLSSAARGIYSSYSVRNVPEYYREKYFQRSHEQYELAPEIRTSVRFRSLNLVEDRAGAEWGNFDVVFCRNVLIYFDEKAKQKAVSFLYDSLRPGGFLFIGSSESLHSVTRAFRPVTMQKVVVYEKV